VQTRRQFVTTAGTAAAAVILGPSAVASGRGSGLLPRGRFADGVAAGDPTPRGITLWTRVTDLARSGSVEIEVARERSFARVVARRRIRTSDALNGAVKARITGLDPHEQYYYRFSTRGSDSGVGRFRTALPADSRQTVRFAFYSCADYTHGFYNAYELMAREDDIDFVLNLGDYIYAEQAHTRAEGTAVRDDMIGRDLDGRGGGAREAVSLDDYRAKYSLYRSDPSLRRAHARFPFVSVWDDHEVVNNYAGGAPRGGPPAAERFAQRKRAAYRAFFENMPFFPSGRSRIYRSLRFGRTVDLLLLDARQYRADQPCDDAFNARECAERRDPRPFLGDRQMDWLKRRLSRSRAAWKVIGNQVFIMPVKSGPQNYAVVDTWQGYLREREELVGHIGRERIDGVAFATGDFHIFVAADVRPGESPDPATTVATEFHSGSITSQNVGEGQAGFLPGANDQDPRTDPAIVNALIGFNPWVDTGDIDHHGYGVGVATADELKVRFRRLQTIKRRSLERLPDLTWTVGRGEPSIVDQNGAG
jgi:alkaline phosphatase D